MSNTFSKETTITFYDGNEGGYEAVEQAWKKALEEKMELGPAHYLLYAALRGKDWTKCFTPLTRPNKIANAFCYVYPRDAYSTARNALVCATNKNSYWAERLLEPFKGVISEEGLRKVQEALPKEFPLEEARAVWQKNENKRIDKAIAALEKRIAEFQVEEDNPLHQEQIASLNRFLDNLKSRRDSLTGVS